MAGRLKNRPFFKNKGDLKMAEFKFGNFEKEFDALDLDFQTKVENLSEEMDTEIKKLKENAENIKMSEYLKGYCTAVFEFFEKLFDDENAANKMFGKSVNLGECDKAYLCFIEARNKAYKEYQTKAAGALKLNRAQRRTGK